MATITAQRHSNVQLPYVGRSGGPPFRDVLSKRASSREFSTSPLDVQTLADLLWAGFGINRPDIGGRTAPSARNWREIEIYVALHDALYCYNALENRLDFVAAGDMRAATGIQTYAAEAPVNLIYVANYSKMEGAGEPDREFFAGADAAFVAQNVYLFCAAENLATVVRALIDREALAMVMGLRRDQRIILAQSIGHPVR